MIHALTLSHPLVDSLVDAHVRRFPCKDTAAAVDVTHRHLVSILTGASALTSMHALDVMHWL